MRRRKPGSLKPKTVMTTIAVCTAAALAGIGYIWAKTEVWGLSRQIKELELRRDELRRVNEGLFRTYAAMCTHERLAARVKELQLGLEAPAPNQMIRIQESAQAGEQQQDGRYMAARKGE